MAGVRSVRMTDPRAFGHFVGDVIERRAEIAVDPGDELLDASLPHPGAVTYWLDLIAIDVTSGEQDGAKHYRVDLKYQTFYVPLESKRVTIPPLTLRFKAAAGAAAATIPAFSFTMSPLRELFPEKGETAARSCLRPDVGAASDQDGSRCVRSFSHRRQPRFLRSRCLPITTPGAPSAGGRTVPSPRPRAVSGLPPERTVRAPAIAQGLIALHRAFDEVAGQRLLAEDLDRFLASHPDLDRRQRRDHPLLRQLAVGLLRRRSHAPASPRCRRPSFRPWPVAWPASSEAPHDARARRALGPLASAARSASALRRRAVAAGLSIARGLRARPVVASPSIGACRVAGVIAILGLILGLGGVQRLGQTIERLGEGAHIVLLIDRSSSMDNTFAGSEPTEGEASKSANARRLLQGVHRSSASTTPSASWPSRPRRCTSSRSPTTRSRSWRRSTPWTARALPSPTSARASPWHSTSTSRIPRRRHAPSFSCPTERP